jgi:hypothetical protein
MTDLSVAGSKPWRTLAHVATKSNRTLLCPSQKPPPPPKTTLAPSINFASAAPSLHPGCVQSETCLARELCKQTPCTQPAISAVPKRDTHKTLAPPPTSANALAAQCLLPFPKRFDAPPQALSPSSPCTPPPPPARWLPFWARRLNAPMPWGPFQSVMYGQTKPTKCLLPLPNRFDVSRKLSLQHVLCMPPPPPP